MRRTGATRVTAVALRLAAPLLCSAMASLGPAEARSNAERCVGNVPLRHLVLWDPVLDGATWYADSAAEHRVCVRGLAGVRRGRPPRRHDGVEELCGTSYARATLRELAALRL